MNEIDRYRILYGTCSLSEMREKIFRMAEVQIAHKLNREGTLD